MSGEPPAIASRCSQDPLPGRAVASWLTKRRCDAFMTFNRRDHGILSTLPSSRALRQVNATLCDQPCHGCRPSNGKTDKLTKSQQYAAGTPSIQCGTSTVKQKRTSFCYSVLAADVALVALWGSPFAHSDLHMMLKQRPRFCLVPVMHFRFPLTPCS